MSSSKSDNKAGAASTTESPVAKSGKEKKEEKKTPGKEDAPAKSKDAETSSAKKEEKSSKGKKAAKDEEETESKADKKKKPVEAKEDKKSSDDEDESATAEDKPEYTEKQLDQFMVCMAFSKKVITELCNELAQYVDRASFPLVAVNRRGIRETFFNIVVITRRAYLRLVEEGYGENNQDGETHIAPLEITDKLRPGFGNPDHDLTYNWFVHFPDPDEIPLNKEQAQHQVNTKMKFLVKHGLVPAGSFTVEIPWASRAEEGVLKGQVRIKFDQKKITQDQIVTAWVVIKTTNWKHPGAGFEAKAPFDVKWAFNMTKPTEHKKKGFKSRASSIQMDLSDEDAKSSSDDEDDKPTAKGKRKPEPKKVAKPRKTGADWQPAKGGAKPSKAKPTTASIPRSPNPYESSPKKEKSGDE